MAPIFFLFHAAGRHKHNKEVNGEVQHDLKQLRNLQSQNRAETELKTVLENTLRAKKNFLKKRLDADWWLGLGAISLTVAAAGLFYDRLIQRTRVAYLMTVTGVGASALSSGWGVYSGPRQKDKDNLKALTIQGWNIRRDTPMVFGYEATQTKVTPPDPDEGNLHGAATWFQTAEQIDGLQLMLKTKKQHLAEQQQQTNPTAPPL